MSERSEFIDWLRTQVGEAYVWGGQGEKVHDDGTVTRDGKRLSTDWRQYVKNRETSETNALRAEGYITRKLAIGAKEVACYDCSGLIMRYLQNMKGLIKGDMSSNTLLATSKRIARSELEPGDLLFRVNGGRAYHVGVYMGGGAVIEAAGRDLGVVMRDIDAAGRGYWNAYGAIPALREDDEDAAPRFATCSGGSVNVRSGAGTEHPILAVAHRGDMMIAVKSPTDGWANVALYATDRLVTGFMSEKYIKNIQGE